MASALKFLLRPRVHRHQIIRLLVLMNYLLPIFQKMCDTRMCSSSFRAMVRSSGLMLAHAELMYDSAPLGRQKEQFRSSTVRNSKDPRSASRSTARGPRNHVDNSSTMVTSSTVETSSTTETGKASGVSALRQNGGTAMIEMVQLNGTQSKKTRRCSAAIIPRLGLTLTSMITSQWISVTSQLSRWRISRTYNSQIRSLKT